MFQVRLFILILSILALASCEDSEGTRKVDRGLLGGSKPSLRVVLDGDETVIFGDTLRLTISPVDPDLVIESLELSVPDNPVLSVKSTDSIANSSVVVDT